MKIVKLLLYFNTIRDLKFIQLWHRIPVLKSFGRNVSKETLDYAEAGKMNGWVSSIPSASSYKKKNIFTFLNQTHTFSDYPDWDFRNNGLLWAYNLNYFEFLEQPDMDSGAGFNLIDDYLQQYPKIKTGHDPYPISLRLIFWIRFFIRQNKVPGEKYLFALHKQAKELQTKPEYHLLGNHLLENAFALFFTGSYLGDKEIIQQAKKLLQKQLEEQVLQDGGHFELSPMYHQLMLYRLLDVINMARACISDTTKDILPFLEQKASIMLSWMRQMRFSDGTFPLFNDAAYDIAPDPAALTAYAERLDIPQCHRPLSQSGYRKWTGNNWEVIMDVGQPGPSYQPGHAHCDALSFVLQVDGKPVLVDTGTSVYGGNIKKRKIERSTASHNTVQVRNREQSEVWGDFRMARKARILILKEDVNYIEASHNGFFFRKTIHKRVFNQTDCRIFIHDEIRNRIGEKYSAQFHFHPDISLIRKEDHDFYFDGGHILFVNATTVEKFVYDYAPRFGETMVANGLSVTFDKRLSTEIHLNV